MKLLYWLVLATGPIALLLWWLGGFSAPLVEQLYSRALYPWIMAPWSRLVGLFPFALAPLLVLLLLVGAISLFFLAGPLKALSTIAAGVSVLVAWFVLGWGMNYQRQSWAESHHWAVKGGTLLELEALSRQLADGLGELRSRALSSGTPDWTAKALIHEVSQAYQSEGEGDPLLSGDWADPKPFPFPEAMSWLGIAGIFIPHTAEPFFNPGPADWQAPFTAAHEAAHLRGWAREDEANFLAYWVLRGAPNPLLQYSARSFALLYVASALEEQGGEGRQAWSRVLATLDEGVQADWNRSFAYWKRFQGPARVLSQAVNDAYLKSQGQTDGVKSYGRMVDLLLACQTQTGPRTSKTAP